MNQSKEYLDACSKFARAVIQQLNAHSIVVTNALLVGDPDAIGESQRRLDLMTRRLEEFFIRMDLQL